MAQMILRRASLVSRTRQDKAAEPGCTKAKSRYATAKLARHALRKAGRYLSNRLVRKADNQQTGQLGVSRPRHVKAGRACLML